METAFRYPENNRLADRMSAEVAAAADACRKARGRSGAGWTARRGGA